MFSAKILIRTKFLKNLLSYTYFMNILLDGLCLKQYESQFLSYSVEQV